jgi:hypothetical protein
MAWISRVVVLCATNISAQATGCNGAPLYGTATNFPGGDSPDALAIGDLNGDGTPDLAVTSYFLNTVSILAGNGAGAFTAIAIYPVGYNPRAVVVGDLNGDGRLDVVTANAASNDVSVLLSSGQSGFASAVSHAVGNSPRSLVVCDLNADGFLDISAANLFSSNISVLLGVGGGLFTSATSFPLAAPPFSIAAADVNGDGKIDFVAVHETPDSVSVVLGNGSGGFGAPMSYSMFAGAAPISVVIGDLNGDGRLDLATANYGTGVNSVSILLGDGAGAFGAGPIIPVGTNPNSIVAGDLNLDGQLDLATSNSHSADVSVLLGDGIGGFGVSGTYLVGTDPNSIAIADLNGDGTPDIATPVPQANSVSILINQSCPAPPPPSLVPFGAGTPGCTGPNVLTGSQTPHVNSPSFSLPCTNAPPLSTGLWMITDAADVAGSDPFAIGVLLHVDLLTATQLIALNGTSNANGVGAAPAPIPNFPPLAGSTFYAQALWAWPINVCFNFPYGLSTSNGLAITILP